VVGGTLKLSWTYYGLEHDGDEREDVPGATAVEAIKVDLKKVAVAYQNSAIKVFDIEDGESLCDCRRTRASVSFCISFPSVLDKTASYIIDA